MARGNRQIEFCCRVFDIQPVLGGDAPLPPMTGQIWIDTDCPCEGPWTAESSNDLGVRMHAFLLKDFLA